MDLFSTRWKTQFLKFLMITNALFKSSSPFDSNKGSRCHTGALVWSIAFWHSSWSIASFWGKLANSSIMNKQRGGHELWRPAHCFLPVILYLHWTETLNEAWWSSAGQTSCLHLMTVCGSAIVWDLILATRVAHLSTNCPQTAWLVHGFNWPRGVGGRRRRQSCSCSCSSSLSWTYRAFPGTPLAFGSGSPTRTWPLRMPAAPKAATWAASWLGAAPSNHPHRMFGQFMLGGWRGGGAGGGDTGDTLWWRRLQSSGVSVHGPVSAALRVPVS